MVLRSVAFVHDGAAMPVDRELRDKALAIPNLYTKSVCRLHCPGEDLFVIGAFRNIGSA